MTAADGVAKASGGAVVATRAGGILEVTINRPEKLNAINSAVLAGLAASVECVATDSRVRCVVLRGAGRAFSAGGDLEEVQSLVRDPVRFDQFLDGWHATLDAIQRLPVPTVAAAHGVAFAGGFEVLQVCDVVVVGDATRIGDQHATYGLFPAGGSTQRLPRLVGLRRATWLLLSGEAVTPEAALQMGLVTEVVPEAQVVARAFEMAAQLAARSAGGHAAIKEALRVGEALPVGKAIRAERTIALRHMASDDVQIGLAAFRDRVRPEFPTSE